MTNKAYLRYLKEAIEIAVGNGWDAFGMVTAVGFRPETVIVNYGESQIIFDLGFAEALFQGQDGFINSDEVQVGLGKFTFKWHLQEMVLKKDRLKYLKEFLEKR